MIYNFKPIDEIRKEFNSKGDLIFRTAIATLIEYGKENIIENHEEIIKSINERHDKAEKEKKLLIMTREFEIAIQECIYALAMQDTYTIIAYIQSQKGQYKIAL